MFYREALSQLDQWSNTSNRKPLILRGARQVGKTTLVKMFSNKFTTSVYLNLEKKEDCEIFTNNQDIEDIVQVISIKKNCDLLNEKVLLFIDEIQNSPEAIMQMRYFFEEYKNIYLIAAGSLLEIMIGKKQISFPVGRVDYLFLYPVTFREFLQAKGNVDLCNLFDTVPVPEYTHSLLLNEFHEYAMLGGMPEIVQSWIDNKDVFALKKIYRNLLVSYYDDITKYARNHTTSEVIRHSIDTIPIEAGKRITFHNFGNSNYQSREVGEALRAIEKAMLIDLVYPTTKTELPVISNKKKKPRLQFLDTGIMNFVADILDQYVGVNDLATVHKGRLIEHIIGQELKVVLSNKINKLSFWVREKKQAQAEIDYLMPFNGRLVPIEVKSGATGSLKSLHLFMEVSESTTAIRFYSGKINAQKIELPSGKSFTLLNLPYYLAGNIENYLEHFSIPTPS